jgi:isopentenyl diphosphate isomerase/L-lactate dehydrogenase-like FMN-dependent dehydrogenase
MVLSTWSTSTIEEVARSSPRGLKWYHLYVLPNEQENISCIHRAEKAGYKAIVVTVDSPYRGQKYPVERNPFSMPPHLSFANLDSIMELFRSDTMTAEKYTAVSVNSRNTWDVIPWLRSVVYFYHL